MPYLNSHQFVLKQNGLVRIREDAFKLEGDFNLLSENLKLSLKNWSLD